MEVAGDAGNISQADPIKIYSACGKFSANETADLIGRAKLVITSDNAWMQVAAALKKPVVALRQGTGFSEYFPPFYPQQMLQSGKPLYKEVNGFSEPLFKKQSKELGKPDARLLSILLQAVKEQLRK
jgi:ADP-heptose:LPS heptosyltransferase